MELVLNLDKIQSESVSQYAKDILDNQNPYKNFKIENYKYAQLHKEVKTEILLRDINFSKLLDNTKNITSSISNPFDLLLKIIRLTSFVEDLDICIFSFIWEISKNKFLSSNVSKFTDLVSLFTKEETLKKLSSLL